MSDLPDFVLRLLDKIATDEGFVEHRIETTAGSKRGDGFMGLMVCATIVGTRKTDKKTTKEDELHLLCKLQPTNPERRKEFMSDVVFEREVLAYTEIIPLLVAFQREKGLTEGECFTAFPKCYAAVADAAKGEFALIMEDLRARGFVLWPKTKSFDIDHARTVIENLAKYHAISVALRDQRPDEYASISKHKELMLDFFKNDKMVQMFSLSYDRAIAVLRDPKHIEIAKHVRDDMRGFIEQCVGVDVKDQFSVMSHGDCWINNMLFQYKDDAVGDSSFSQQQFLHSVQFLFCRSNT